MITGIETKTCSQLNDEVEKTLSTHIQDGYSCALLDFPFFANVGDSAIWLGTRRLLKNLGIKPVYMCDHRLFNEREMRSQITPDTTILLQGGGNFGDLYSPHQTFREQVLLSFPNNRIIFLPQSIHFKDEGNLARARSIINGHKKLTILLRDERSLNIAHREFTVPSYLCPDMAFALEGSITRCSPVYETFGLIRQDNESAIAEHLSPSIEMTDWDCDSDVLWRLSNMLIGGSRWPGTSWRVSPAFRPPVYDWFASQRLKHGCRLLSQGKVLITDRLHGHILCLLLGIEHVILDNNTGKLSAFFQTWTAGNPLAHWADSLPHALDLAAVLTDSKTPCGTLPA
jgi:pyruvyl transferase EpsO